MALITIILVGWIASYGKCRQTECGPTESQCGVVNTTCMPQGSTCCGSHYDDGFFCERGQHCEWTKSPSNNTLFETKYGFRFIPQCCPDGHFPCLVDSWMDPIPGVKGPGLPWLPPKKPTKCCKDGEVCVENPKPRDPDWWFKPPPPEEEMDITCQPVDAFLAAQHWSDSDCANIGPLMSDIFCGINAYVPSDPRALAATQLPGVILIAACVVLGLAIVGAAASWLAGTRWALQISRGPTRANHPPKTGQAVTVTKEERLDGRQLEIHVESSPVEGLTARNQRATLWALGLMLLGCGSACLVVSVLARNITKKNQASDPTVSGDSTPLIAGTCDDLRLKLYNMISHLVLTVLATIILATSAYVQKACASPTEEDVLALLASNKDVRFGSNRPRPKIGPFLIWLFLFATSLPVHLILNSATGWALRPFEKPNVFGVRLNDTIAADRNFRFELYNGIQYDMTSIPWRKMEEWKRVNTQDCLEYVEEQNSFVLGYRNLAVVVTDASAIGGQNLVWEIFADDDSKAFRVAPEVSFVNSKNATSTSLTADDIAYCYVDADAASCQVSIRWCPLLITGVLAVAKSIIVLYSAWRVPHFKGRLLSCLGDVIFLGAVNQSLKIEDAGCYRQGSEMRPRVQGEPRTWVARKARTYAPNPTIMDPLLLLCFVILVLVLVGKGAAGVGAHGMGTIDAGGVSFGRMHRDNFLSSVPSPFINAAMLVNLPQLGISLWYLCINAWVGKLWLEREWQSYYLKPQKIRLNAWQGARGTRSTRWLQFPYWLTAILMLLSVGTHWVGSQVYTPVEVLPRRVNPDWGPGGTMQLVVNYSAPAVLVLGIATGAATFSLVTCWVLAAKQKRWMPGLSGSCRTVLSYCHGLRVPLPEAGVAWGDISSTAEGNAVAGFGEAPTPMRSGVEYSTK